VGIKAHLLESIHDANLIGFSLHGTSVIMSLEFYALQAKAWFIFAIDVFLCTRSITYNLFVAHKIMSWFHLWMIACI